jgi:hypothetical protein
MISPPLICDIPGVNQKSGRCQPAQTTLKRSAARKAVNFA